RICTPEFLIESADQHDAPKAFDSAPCLFHALEPVEHAGALDPRRASARSGNGHQRSRNAPLVVKSESAEYGERGSHVQRRRKPRTLDGRPPAGPIYEIEPAIKPYAVAGINSPVKIGEIGAATERHVLAIIHF